jgi:hypothetical protein
MNKHDDLRLVYGRSEFKYSTSISEPVAEEKEKILIDL